MCGAIERAVVGLELRRKQTNQQSLQDDDRAYLQCFHYSVIDSVSGPTICQRPADRLDRLLVGVRDHFCSAVNNIFRTRSWATPRRDAVSENSCDDRTSYRMVE